MHPIYTRDKLSGIFGKISTLFHNVRYLYEMLGSTDISAIGNGTITGAIDSLNTDMNTRIKTLLINHTLQADDTTYALGNYELYRCGMVLVFAVSSITPETTILLISTSSDAVDANGILKIVESNMNYNNTKTVCNDYFLWDGQLCIHNLQSVHEYLTVRFIPFF